MSAARRAQLGADRAAYRGHLAGGGVRRGDPARGAPGRADPAPARARREVGMSVRWWRQPGVPTALLLLLAFGASAAWSPRFLDARYLLDRSTLSLETGLMAV